MSLLSCPLEYSCLEPWAPYPQPRGHPGGRQLKPQRQAARHHCPAVLAAASPGPVADVHGSEPWARRSETRETALSESLTSRGWDVTHGLLKYCFIFRSVGIHWIRVYNTVVGIKTCLKLLNFGVICYTADDRATHDAPPLVALASSCTRVRTLGTCHPLPWKHLVCAPRGPFPTVWVRFLLGP